MYICMHVCMYVLYMCMAYKCTCIYCMSYNTHMVSTFDLLGCTSKRVALEGPKWYLGHLHGCDKYIYICLFINACTHVYRRTTT